MLDFDPAVDPGGTRINLLNVLPEYSFIPVTPESIEIIPAFDGKSATPSVTVFIDDKSYILQGIFTSNLVGINHLFIPYQTGMDSLQIRIYDRPFFDTSLYGSSGLPVASTEPNSEQDYNTSIYNNAGVWTWSASGDYPFNSGPVTTPIKLRDPNVYRVNHFIFFGQDSLDDAALFPMYWGTSSSACNIPFHCFYTPGNNAGNGALGSQCPKSPNAVSYGIIRNNSSSYILTTQQCMHRFPIDIFDGMKYITYAEMIPRGEIWISCKPSIPASGSTVYSQPLAFLIY